MADLEDIYEGGKYDMDSAFDAAYGIPENYGKSFLGFDYRMPASQIGVIIPRFSARHRSAPFAILDLRFGAEAAGGMQ